MKLTYPSSSQCTLQIKPWGGRLFGLLFIVIGVAILCLFFISSEITCTVKRAGIQIELNQTTQMATIRFSELKNVRVQNIPFADISSFVVDSCLDVNSSSSRSSSSVGDLANQFSQNNDLIWIGA